MALSPCNTVTNEQGRELVNHGTASFPIACYHDDLSREEVPWHWHDELELILVTEGNAVIAAGTEKHIVKEGNGFFINAGVLHAAWRYQTKNCRFHSEVFHPRLVGGSIDSIYWQKYLRPLMADASIGGIYFDRTVAWQKECLTMLENAWQACTKESSAYEFLVRENLSRIIFSIVNHHTMAGNRISEKSVRDGERMKAMLQYIHEHYAEEVTTSQIAESAMISISECLRCFHNMIGTTPIQYLKQYRISCAAQLLTDTDRKIVDIGMQSGFQDMSYFSKTFKEMRGCTPAQYRKACREQGA